MSFAGIEDLRPMARGSGPGNPGVNTGVNPIIPRRRVEWSMEAITPPPPPPPPPIQLYREGVLVEEIDYGESWIPNRVSPSGVPFPNGPAGEIFHQKFEYIPIDNKPPFNPIEGVF